DEDAKIMPNMAAWDFSFKPSRIKGLTAFKPSGPAMQSMGENVGLRPARQVELGAGGQELEARPCELGAALARQHGVQNLFQLVEMGHVTRRIGELLLGQFRRT